MIKHIGLTGGIGSGKSTVAHMLVKLGAHLVDLDAISRQLTGPQGAAMPAIAQAFGPHLLADDGSLHRERMRDLAFADSEALQRLEAILHPLIGQHAQAQAAQAKADQRVIFDVPLLVENLSRWQPLMDRIVVVDCLPDTQIDRVMRRTGWSREAVEHVLTKQAQREQRLAVADHVLHNGGTDLTALQQQVQALWDMWNNAG